MSPIGLSADFPRLASFAFASPGLAWTRVSAGKLFINTPISPAAMSNWPLRSSISSKLSVWILCHSLYITFLGLGIIHSEIIYLLVFEFAFLERMIRVTYHLYRNDLD